MCSDRKMIELICTRVDLIWLLKVSKPTRKKTNTGGRIKKYINKNIPCPLWRGGGLLSLLVGVPSKLNHSALWWQEQTLGSRGQHLRLLLEMQWCCIFWRGAKCRKCRFVVDFYGKVFGCRVWGCRSGSLFLVGQLWGWGSSTIQLTFHFWKFQEKTNTS